HLRHVSMALTICAVGLKAPKSPRNCTLVTIISQHRHWLYLCYMTSQQAVNCLVKKDLREVNCGAGRNRAFLTSDCRGWIPGRIPGIRLKTTHILPTLSTKHVPCAVQIPHCWVLRT
ncbi:hypothetical protein T310_10084, partial [Rasamsonia emersonii CBS 393.64]